MKYDEKRVRKGTPGRNAGVETRFMVRFRTRSQEGKREADVGNFVHANGMDVENWL